MIINEEVGTPVTWDNKKVSHLKTLVYKGYTAHEISALMSDRFGQYISGKAIEAAKARYRVLQYCVAKDKTMKLYNDLVTLPPKNYIVFCDFHSPYYSEHWFNRGLAVADAMGIKDCIIAGDLVDLDFIKSWPNDRIEEQSTLDSESRATEPVFKALDYFDNITLIKGNHENRVNRATDGKIQARHLFEIMGQRVWEEKFTYSVYDKLFIGDKWMIVHPRSYSQISASVAVRLAEKFHRHILNAHGHFFAMRYDRSGQYVALDLGGMFDPEKIGYINLKTTTHPAWNPGFVVITEDNKLHIFHEHVDWHHYGID